MPFQAYDFHDVLPMADREKTTVKKKKGSNSRRLLWTEVALMRNNLKYANEHASSRAWQEVPLVD